MEINFRIFILMSLFLCSCAAIKKDGQKEQENFPLKTVDKKESWENIVKNLSKITNSAKEKGEEYTSFLASDFFIKATDFSMRGDSKAAELLYKQIIELRPNDLYIKKKYAVELIRNGKLKESKVILEEIFEKGQHEESIGLILGGVYTALEDKKSARKIYHAVLKHHKNSEEACVFLSKSYGMEKQFKKSERILNRCQKSMPKRALFTYYKGKLAVARGKRKLAEKLFRKALKIDEKYYQATLALGLLYEEKGQYARAIEVYDNFLKKNPENYAVLARVVQLKFSTKDSKNIINYAEKLSRLDTSDLNLKVRLGILYTDAKRYNDAIGIFKEILNSVPDSDKILYYLGSLYQEIGEEENSLQYFSKIPHKSDLFHDGHVQMAQILQAMAESAKGDEENAVIKRFTHFINEKSRKFPELRIELKLILATWYENRKNVPDAIAVMTSIKGVENYTDAHDYYLASLYEKNKEFPQAEKLIYKILEKDPKNAHAWNFLGYSLLERGIKMEKAFEYISKAVKLSPKDGYIRDSLGWYYYKIGKINLALKEVKKAWSFVKTDVVISKHLAMIYAKLKKYHLAKKHFVEALKNCKVESERQDVKLALEELENMRLPASK